MAQSSVRKAINKVNNTVMVSAYLSGDQSGLSGNGWNKIDLNAVTFDVGSNFDTSTKKFTAPVTGLYHIYGSVSFNTLTINKAYIAALYKNGVLLTKTAGQVVVADTLIIPVQNTVFLQQNDYIELYAYPSVGGGVNTVSVTGNAYETFLVIRLITKEGIRQ